MKPILPGATIGILGGGQLGRMIALEGRPLGYRFIAFDPTPDGPAAQVCDDAIVAPFTDKEKALDFAARCELITLEWENVPAELVDIITSVRPVRPEASVLRVIQDRWVQREFLKKNGFPQTDYRAVTDLKTDAKKVGYPCILKSRRNGYDGKGQSRLGGPRDLPAAAEPLRLIERQVTFAKEISVILARAEDGRAAVYPLAENVHRNGILHTTRAPALVSEKTAQAAQDLALDIAAALGHVGVMAVEMFVLDNGGLLVNEIAPRVHNSGHFTLGACVTSQFEQHVRAICGLPLGDPSQRLPAVMINLLGNLWENGEPLWERVLSRADARLHLYGKAKPAPGRKMGHLLLLGDPEQALAEADTLLGSLRAALSA